MNRSVLSWSANVGARALDLAGLLPSRRGKSLRVLIYHGILASGSTRVGIEAVNADALRRQIRYFKRNFRLLHADQLDQGLEADGSRPLALLTFDDGIGNNAVVAAPILEELKVPAIFFITLRHTRPGELLWFTHAAALFSLCQRPAVRLLGCDWPLTSPGKRRAAYGEFVKKTHVSPIHQIYKDLARYPAREFVPTEVIEGELRGMTRQEIAAIARSRYISIGAHTFDHPYLVRCSDAELRREIWGSKTELERIAGRPVTSFAYPDGDYDERVAAAVESAGFQFAFSVNERNAGNLGRMSVMRIGIYHRGLGLLALKACGWGS